MKPNLSRFRHRLIRCAGVVAIALLTNTNLAVAQSGISAGSGLDYNASLTGRGLTTDNYFYSNADADKVSAQGYSLQPRAASRYTQGVLQASLTADANFTQWDVPAKLGDIFDYGAAANMTLAPAYRHNFTLDAEYRRGHDAAGLVRTDTQNQPVQMGTGKLDKWQDISAGLQYRFGGDGARANAQLSYSARDRNYLSNRDQTRSLDNQSDTANYTLFYNYSPKTAWLMGMDRIGTRFTQRATATTRDAVEYRLLSGIRWQATAKTGGDVRFGYYSREPDDRSNPTGGFAWQAEVQWKPRTGSNFELRTGRSSTASYRTDTRFNDDRSAAISWQQSWNSRISSRASYNYVQSRLIGTGINDKNHNAGLNIEYKALPALSIALDGFFLGRSSNQPLREYDALRAELGVTLKL